MKKYFVAVCFFVAFTLSAPAQAPQTEIQVRKIEVNLETAPKYNVSAQRQRQTPQSRPWLVVEADLLCEADWADEVQVKFYVVANYGPTAKEKSADGYDVLTTTVSVVNMAGNKSTGQKNIVPIFMDSNTVRRYAAVSKDQFIPEVAVQVMSKGVLQDTKWMKSEGSGRFWEKKQPKSGILLNLMQSPWAPAFIEYYEQVKPMGGGGGGAF